MTWFKKDKTERRYKIKSINTFAWDRSANNKKKYRKIFDTNEINYLSAAIELYNKLFDEEDWEVKITFKAFTLDKDGYKGKEHCSNTTKFNVSKEKNILNYEYGWGNKKYGAYWKKGSYMWEIYIDDELVGTTNFTIENIGRVTGNNNPYFSVTSLKVYEAQKENIAETKRVYLKEFESNNTRYIMGELKIKSKISSKWKAELFFNFYDDTGLFIGSSNVQYTINPSKKGSLTTITAGWGNSNGKSWLVDNYRLEVVFMDTVVGMIPFKVGDKRKEQNSNSQALLNSDAGSLYDVYNLKNAVNSLAKNKTQINETNSKEDDDIKVDDRPVEEIIAELESLIGLNKVKSKIKEYTDYITYLKFRKDKGIKEEETINLHSVFTGNPGTGKTTVVKLLGKIYHSMGLLSKGHVLTVASNDLIAGYVRQTGKNTKKFIEKARGGILFIDEAYMLYKADSPNDYGGEAIAALIKEMSDGSGDIAIMVAGYPKEMDSFINSNPGLKSRFRNFYHFDDYTPTELVAIAKFAAKKKDVILNKNAEIKLKKIVTDAYRKRDRTFGNARMVFSMIDEAKMNLGIRLVRDYKPKEVTKELLTLIQEQDIEDLSQKDFNKRIKLEIDNSLLEEALEELNYLTGLEVIKQEVHDLISLTKYYRELDRDILKAFSMHSVFLGNPGTGKTTVARIMGKVYKALGLLERGHLIEADGGDLIAGYIGQTSIKTKELIKKAMGGILFIDEAYAITESSSGSNDYGKKAIAALIKEMEDHRGEFGLIVAGYTDNMKGFLEANPGMKSRFDRTFHFQDFTEEELWNIAVSMFAKKGLKADKKATEHIKVFIKNLYQNRSKFFGNARSIRKMVEKSYRNQELRMAKLDKSKRTKKMMETLVLEDVLEFDMSKIEISKRKSVGFK